MQLVVVRHGESEWNKLNLFTGWRDVGLSERGRAEASSCGQLLHDENFDFDICYTSYLKRAIETLDLILEKMDRQWLPVAKSWRLNERHYGALQGLNKAETAAKYGEKQVAIWRRSYDVPPPPLEEDSADNPRRLAPYREVDPQLLPLCESLADTFKRVIPYYEGVIRKDIVAGKRVLISAHGNSLRALMKHLEHIEDAAISGVELPTGVPLVYDFDAGLKVVSRRFLGDAEAIKARTAEVANQGKAR